MIVLDASALIGHFHPLDAHHAIAVERLRELSESPLGASSFTLAEVYVWPAREGRLVEMREALDALGIQELRLPDNAAERLAGLRVDTGLKLPDCCVLLAAEEARGAVLSFDERLVREAARRGLAAG